MKFISFILFWGFNFLFGISPARAQSYRPGSAQHLIFADETAKQGMTNSSYNPYNNCGAGGCSPEEMRTRAKDDDPSDQNPFGGPQLDDLNYKFVNGNNGEYRGADIKADIGTRSDSDYERMAKLLDLGNTARWDSDEKKEAIELAITSIIADSLKDKYFDDLYETPFSERGFEIIAGGNAEKAEQLMDAYVTLHPLSREMLGELANYSIADLADTDKKQAMLDEIKDAYYTTYRKHLDYDEAEQQLYFVLGQVSAIRGAGPWEGLCLEAAGWNSNPLHQSLVREFHTRDGNIFLCEKPIGMHEVENLIPFLYDQFKVDEVNALGEGHMYQAPYKSSDANHGLTPGDLAYSSSHPSEGEVLQQERRMSTFLYQNYYDALGIHPSGMDFCDFDQFLDQHQASDGDQPYPIIDNGDGSEVWNFVALESNRRVNNGISVVDLAKSFKGKTELNVLTPEMNSHLDLLLKHSESLCQDDDFLSLIGGTGQAICKKITRYYPDPIYMVDGGLSGFYECAELDASCLGKNDLECSQKKQNCQENFNQRCKSNCNKATDCNYDYQEGGALCYFSASSSQYQGQNFGKTYLLREKFLKMAILNLMDHIRSKLSSELRTQLGTFKIVDVIHGTSVLAGGDYYSRPGDAKKINQQAYMGDVLIKSNQPLNCRWKNVWRPGDPHDPKSKYKTELPQRIYQLDIPQCQEEDNYAIDLLKRLRDCPTLKELTDQFTKLILDLSLGNTTSDQAVLGFETWAHSQKLNGVDVEQLVFSAREMVGINAD